MTFKEDFKPTKVYNKLVNDVCYNADCLEEFEKQRLVVANPFSYNKSTRTGIVAEFDNGYHLSKEVGIKRNFVTIGMRVWDIIRKNRYAVIISFIGYIAENIKFNSNVIYISHDLIKGYGLVKPNRRDYYNAISYLEDENIIKRTNLQNIYVVNPIYIFRGDVNKLINIISEAKLIKTFDDKDRLIVDKFVLFKNDTDKGIVIANKDLYATEVVDIGEDAAAGGIVLQVIQHPIHLIHLPLGVLVLHRQLVAVGLADAATLIRPGVPDVGGKLVDVIAFFLPDPQKLIRTAFDCCSSKCQCRKFF